MPMESDGFDQMQQPGMAQAQSGLRPATPMQSRMQQSQMQLPPGGGMMGGAPMMQQPDGAWVQSGLRPAAPMEQAYSTQQNQRMQQIQQAQLQQPGGPYAPSQVSMRHGPPPMMPSGGGMMGGMAPGQRGIDARSQALNQRLGGAGVGSGAMRDGGNFGAPPMGAKPPGAFGGMSALGGGMGLGAGGMKKGGFVPFAKAKPGDAKGGEKKMPPWLNKGKEEKFAKGGGVESKGKTVGKVIKMAGGGVTRADGIAQRGHTRGKYC